VSARSGVLAEWVDHVVELGRRPAFARGEIAAHLAETFQCHVTWNWAEPEGGFGFEFLGALPTSDVDVNRWALEGMRSHPLLAWFAHVRDPAAMTIDRVPRELVPPQGRAFLDEVLEEPGFDQQLSIPHHLGAASYRAFVLAQSRHDFSDDQLDLARRIQPLLAVLDRQAEVLAETPCPVEAATTEALTGREVAVLRLLAEGLTAAAIGHRLLVSPRTVHCHLGHIYRKLGVRDRMMAVLAARELGVLERATGGVRAAGQPLPGRSFSWPGPRVYGHDVSVSA